MQMHLPKGSHLLSRVMRRVSHLLSSVCEERVEREEKRERKLHHYHHHIWLLLLMVLKLDLIVLVQYPIFLPHPLGEIRTLNSNWAIDIFKSLAYWEKILLELYKILKYSLGMCCQSCQDSTEPLVSFSHSLVVLLCIHSSNMVETMFESHVSIINQVSCCFASHFLHFCRLGVITCTVTGDILVVYQRM